MLKLAVFLLSIHQIHSNDNNRKFLCNDGNLVELSQICNGRKDCEDGSDETLTHCLHLLCPANMFRCSYGACIPHHYHCDGITHCADDSDEIYCNQTITSCNYNEFKCESGECIPMQQLCNQHNDCPDQSDENRDLCNEFICPNETYRCNIGGCIRLNQRCNGFKDCIDGSDESEILCRNLYCLKNHCVDEITCPPFTTTTILTKCIGNKRNGLISCNQPLPIGTIVDYKCKPFYIPIDLKHSQNRRMFCQLDGTWSREILKCKPDCGRASSDIKPLIINGWHSRPVNFPWHTILYVLEDGKWNFICSGTLIHESIVITAAHCVWDIDEDLFKIGLGKSFSDYYKIEQTSEFRDVSKIIKHPLYQDFMGNYGSDIAILILNETVRFSSTILPACIDWQSNQPPTQSNHLGLIAGMGVTETGNYSNQLRATYLSLIDYNECLHGQSDDFKKYVTYTTFCAGWSNGTSVCNGDSGGGLMYKTIKNRWILLGLVSVSPRRINSSLCDPKHFTIFTKIHMYIDWLYQNLTPLFDDFKLLI